MLFILLSLDSEDERDEVDFYLDTVLSEQDDPDEPIYLFISGDTNFFHDTKERLKGLREFFFYYLGYSSASHRDLEVIIPILSIHNGKSMCKQISIINDNFSKYSYDFESGNPEGVSAVVYNMFIRLIEASKKKDILLLDIHLKNLKDVFKNLSEQTINPIISLNISFARNIISIENKLFLGSNNSSVAETIKRGQYSDLLDTHLLDLKKEYQLLNKFSKEVCGNFFEGFLKKRIDYVAVNLGVISEVKKRNTNNNLARLLFWHASYFVTLATVYKKRKKYASGLAFILRALECSLQAVLHYHEIGFFKKNGDFVINGTPSKGAGSLWYKVRDTLSESEKRTFQIDQILHLRNQSISGHGFAPLNRKNVDECQNEVLRIISFFDKKVFSSTKYWGGIYSLVDLNNMPNFGDEIIQAVLSKLDLLDATP